MAFLGLIGGVISAIGSLQAGAAAKASGDYQAAVARNNKIIAEQAAVTERQVGHEEERQVLYKYGQALGEAHAAASASGIESESGSPADVRKTLEFAKLVDAGRTAENAERRAYAYEVQGTNYEAEARLREFEGKQQQTASYFSAAGSIIGGLQSAFSGMSGGGGMFGGGGGAVAPKWSEMAAGSSGAGTNLLYSSYGPYTSGPYPTPRPTFYGRYGSYGLPYGGGAMSGI